jgi:hypothetical protein
LGAPVDWATFKVEWADSDVSNTKPANLRRRKPPSATGEQSVLAMFKAPQREGETA